MRQDSGLGLGLTITRMLTALMGGELSMKSEQGRGSVFQLRLFLSEVRVPQAVVHVEHDIIGYHGPRRRVLVVDDHIEHRKVLAGMLEHGSGSIINIASIVSSQKGAPRRFAYGASKAAIIGMTKSIAADFVKDGIRCNAICPGTVESPSLRERLAATGDFAKAHAAFTQRQPMGRLGKPEEIAYAVWFLASAYASYVTGQVFSIDGGFKME